MIIHRLLIPALLCVMSNTAIAQSSPTYPNRAARMVVPWTAGGTADLMARIASLGAEVVSTTPEGLDQFNRAQIALWARVVKASGARVE